MPQAAEYYDTPDEFTELVRDANQQAVSEWDQEFAADIRVHHLSNGLRAYLTDKQWRNLWRIADHVPPLRRKPT